MPVDKRARKVSVNYLGGAITASYGLLESLFGENLTGAGAEVTTKEVTVSGHSRVRIIGGESTGVSGGSYTKKKYPSSVQQSPAGGRPIKLLVDGDYWTARIRGSHQAFSDFLTGATFYLGDALYYKTERGTTYGPFGTDDPNT